MGTKEFQGRKAVLIDGARIPFQRSSTAYKDLMSYDLARYALKGLLNKTQIDPQEVDQVIMGTVVSNLTTSNVARDALLGTALPNNIPAYTVAMACISANQAITNGVDLIRTGQADVVIAGGTESLSDIPIRYKKKFRQKLIETQKYRSPWDFRKFFKGLSWRDVLPEIPGVNEFSTGRSMGQDCDRLAARIGVTRQEQDDYALRSQKNAAQAIADGLLADEIAPVAVPPKFEFVSQDNGVRGDSSIEKLQKLRPAFIKKYGTITAGNASFLTDGAGATLIMSEEKAKALGLTPKAIFHSHVYCAQDPFEELLLGPAYVTPKILDQSGLTLKDIDVFEYHEAFAGQIVAMLKCLESDKFAQENLGRSSKVGEIPLDKFNTLGGSLSIGHPFGATGARLVTTAANRLQREDAQFTLVAGCAAGSLGNAILLERYS